MKRIPLRARDGSVRAYAIVDDADFDWLNQWSWCLKENKQGVYVQRVENRREPDGSRKTRAILMHRQIMGFPDGLVDHREHDGLDNRRGNLRVVSPSQNAQNRRGADRDNATGYRGVTKPRGRRKFRAHATVAGKRHELGSHETAESAASAVRAFWTKMGG